LVGVFGLPRPGEAFVAGKHFNSKGTAMPEESKEAELTGKVLDPEFSQNYVIEFSGPVRFPHAMQIMRALLDDCQCTRL
jgi:hypothetical protein